MRTLRLVVALLAATLLATAVAPSATAAPLTLPAPPRDGLVRPEPPSVSAETWILYDAGAEMVLSSRGPDVERSMASTTKIMTAYVALKYGDLDDQVTISETAAGVGEAEVGLVPGETFALDMLVRALVVRSANDAATAVAEHVGGSVEGFAQLMNQEARRLGMDHSHFVNPHGLDAEGHYSSARDLLTVALAAMEYPEFREMAATQEAAFPEAPDGTERHIESTNRLLEEYPGAIGVKTGFTGQALLVLVAAAEREGRTLFAVVMGADGQGGHFSDAETLLDWGYSDFRTVEVVRDTAYVPPEPERVVEADPDDQPEAEEPPPEPVVVRTVRSADGTPPDLAGALGWVSRVVERLSGG